MISDKAIVNKNSKLDSSVEVGPFSIIGKEVKIGKNVKILSHVNITGDTSISDECEIYSFASIGSAPQDLKFKGEKTKLIIGKKNRIREYVTINPGTEHGGGVTKIGDNCLFTPGRAPGSRRCPARPSGPSYWRGERRAWAR